MAAMVKSPSTNGANGGATEGTGRRADGKFAKGNPGGPGNPHAGKTAKLRAALIRAVGVRDIQTIVKALLKRARNGDVPAAREVLDRCFGRPNQAVGVEVEEVSKLSYRELADRAWAELSDEDVIKKAVVDMRNAGMPLPMSLAAMAKNLEAAGEIPPAPTPEELRARGIRQMVFADDVKSGRAADRTESGGG